MVTLDVAECFHSNELLNGNLFPFKDPGIGTGTTLVHSSNIVVLVGFFKSIYSVLCNMFCINGGNKFLASENISQLLQK